MCAMLNKRYSSLSIYLLTIQSPYTQYSPTIHRLYTHYSLSIHSTIYSLFGYYLVIFKSLSSHYSVTWHSPFLTTHSINNDSLFSHYSRTIQSMYTHHFSLFTLYIYTLTIYPPLTHCSLTVHSTQWWFVWNVLSFMYSNR